MNLIVYGLTGSGKSYLCNCLNGFEGDAYNAPCLVSNNSNKSTT